MVTTVRDPQTRLGRATLGSLGFHVALALCIPALAWTASTAPAVETVSFVRVEHIVIQPPVHLPQPRPVAPHQSVVPKISLVTDHQVLARVSPHRSASPPPASATDLSTAPTQAANSVTGTGTASNESAPRATDAPVTREVASVGTHSAGGYLPFGAEQPDPVLNPEVRRQLDSLGVHVTLTVTVGEDGRTKMVAIEPAVDKALQDRIEGLLADATWDPATCGGGVSCEGRATIRL
jgi:hypothetical protein